jgi:N4-gp56 family major capsid protein
MASITVAATTATATEQAQLYSKDLFHEPHVNSFWKNLQGPGPDYVIQIDDSLKKEQGDRVNFTLFAELTGKGRVVGTANTQLTALEGNEEAPNRYQFGVTLDEIHHSVRTGGKLTEQRLAYKVRPEMKQVLAYWYNRAYDEMIFKKLTGTDYTDDASRTFGDAAVANTNVIRPGGKTAKADIELTDTFVVDLIERAKSMATVGIFGATTAWRIRPFMVGGRPYYGMVIHPYQKYGMRKDPDWKEAVLHARERSQENPIFTGATAIVNSNFTNTSFGEICLN